jgi:hypothetical protein
MTVCQTCGGIYPVGASIVSGRARERLGLGAESNICAVECINGVITSVLLGLYGNDMTESGRRIVETIMAYIVPVLAAARPGSARPDDEATDQDDRDDDDDRAYDHNEDCDGGCDHDCNN